MTTIQQLKQFRQGAYTILGKGRDALFDLMETVLITQGVKSRTHRSPCAEARICGLKGLFDDPLRRYTKERFPL